MFHTTRKNQINMSSTLRDLLTSWEVIYINSARNKYFFESYPILTLIYIFISGPQ